LALQTRLRLQPKKFLDARRNKGLVFLSVWYLAARLKTGSNLTLDSDLRSDSEISSITLEGGEAEALD
jgi:hypothetical protein